MGGIRGAEDGIKGTRLAVFGLQVRRERKEVDDPRVSRLVVFSFRGNGGTWAAFMPPRLAIFNLRADTGTWAVFVALRMVFRALD